MCKGSEAERGFVLSAGGAGAQSTRLEVARHDFWTRPR